MKKLFVTFAALALAVMVSGAALAQGRGGSGGAGGGSHGGMSGGGGWSGGSGGSGGWHGGGGGNWNGGGWHGGGGSWNNGWRGGWYGAGWRGAGWGWGCAGWCGAGWGGYWWPGVGLTVGWPGYWGAWPYDSVNNFGYVSSPEVVDMGSGAWIQQDAAPAYAPQAQPAPAATNFWYYCVDPAGYFPYVKNCNKSWMQVVPQANPGSPVAPRLVQ